MLKCFTATTLGATTSRQQLRDPETARLRLVEIKVKNIFPIRDLDWNVYYCVEYLSLPFTFSWYTDYIEIHAVYYHPVC